MLFDIYYDIICYIFKRYLHKENYYKAVKIFLKNKKILFNCSYSLEFKYEREKIQTFLKALYFYLQGLSCDDRYLLSQKEVDYCYRIITKKNNINKKFKKKILKSFDNKYSDESFDFWEDDVILGLFYLELINHNIISFKKEIPLDYFLLEEKICWEEYLSDEYIIQYI